MSQACLDEAIPNVFDDLKVKVCGNCGNFQYEDAAGDGWCAHYEADRECRDSCPHWLSRNVIPFPRRGD